MAAGERYLTKSEINWLNANGTLTYGSNGLQYFNINGTAGNVANQNTTPTSAWYHILRMNHGNSAGYYTDIAAPLNDVAGLYWRQIRSGNANGWYKILDSGNYTGYINSTNFPGLAGVRSTTINGDYLRVNTNGTNADLTIPYATVAEKVPMRNIYSETGITEDALRVYQGSGGSWSGSVSTMAYAAILAIGNPSRGFQLWARRATSDGLYWRRGIADATAWEAQKLLLDTSNFASYAVPTGRTVNGKALSSNVTLTLDDLADGSTRKLANYLPIAGGTINSTNAIPLTVNTSASYCYISFSKSGAKKGSIGFYNDSIGTVIQAGNTYINIADEGELKKNNNYKYYHEGMTIPYATESTVIRNYGNPAAYGNNRMIFVSGQFASTYVAEGTGNVFAKYYYPTGSTSVSSNGTANIMTIRLAWDNTNYWKDIFLSPNTEDIWHRSVNNAVGKAWRKILDTTNFVAGTSYQAPISDLATIRSNASNGATAYGWGNYKNDAFYEIQTGATTNFNANSLATTGVHYTTPSDIGSNAAGWTNFPTSSAPAGSFGLLTLKEGNYPVQFFHHYAQADLWFRYKYYSNGSVWGSWIKIYNSANANTTSIPWSASTIFASGAIMSYTTSNPCIIAKRTTTGAANIIMFPDNQEVYGWLVGAQANSSGRKFSWIYRNSSDSEKMYLTTGGTLTTTGDQVISSDATLKENLSGVSYGLSDIAKAPAVTFDWKDGRGRSAGSIAQYWKPIIPELVHGEEGGMTLAYGQIGLLNSILLAREIEKRDEKIEKMSEEISSLKDQLSKMNDKMESILSKLN